jgi:predicted MFS family arabinose efflux permease
MGYHFRADPVLIGLIPATYALPGMLLGSWAGSLADRLPKVRILVVSDLFMAMFTFLLLLSPDEVWMLLILTVRSVFGVIFYPAQQALTRQIAGERWVARVTVWNGLVDQLGKIAAPLLGGVLLAFVSPAACLVIKGCAHLGSMLLFWGIRESRDSTGKEEIREWAFRAWREGWGIVRCNRMIFLTLILGFLFLSVFQVVDSQLTVMFRLLFPEDPSIMGWVIAVVGVGGAMGALLMQRIPRLPYGWGMGGGSALLGLSLVLVGIMKPGIPVIWVYMTGWVAGFGQVWIFITFQVVLQKESDSDTVGRVFGVQNALSSLALIVAPVAGGILVHVTGVGKMFLGVGLVIFLLGLAALFGQKYIWRPSLDREKLLQSPARAFVSKANPE